MKSFNFTYLSDILPDAKNDLHCRSLDVHFVVNAVHEDEAFVEELEVFDPNTLEYIQLENLPLIDRQNIENQAEGIASENAHDVYYEDAMCGGRDRYDD